MIIISNADRRANPQAGVATGRIVLELELVLDSEGIADLLHLAKREGWQNYDLIEEAV